MDLHRRCNISVVEKHHAIVTYPWDTEACHSSIPRKGPDGIILWNICPREIHLQFYPAHLRSIEIVKLQNSTNTERKSQIAWWRHQGWGQICICICKYKYKYKYGVFVFDQISNRVFVFVFVFDSPYLVYLTNTFSNTLFSCAVF